MRILNTEKKVVVNYDNKFILILFEIDAKILNSIWLTESLQQFRLFFKNLLIP